MNGLLIATGILFFLCMIVGFARGFIKIVASLAVTIIMIVFVMFLTPYVSEQIRKITPLESVVQEKCMERLLLQKVDGNGEITREKQIELIEQTELPGIFRELLLENNNSEIYRVLGVSTFGEYMGSYLAKMIADILAFLIILLATTIILRPLVHVFGIIGNLPVIGGLNRIAGGVLGLGTGVVIMWIVFIVITLGYNTGIGKACFENIRESQLLTFLYEKNILMNFLVKFR